LALEQTWRWWGPKDPISLQEIRQTGVTGIVTALHHIPYGEIWTRDEIYKRKNAIEKEGLKWSVVESVPVHEDIKKRNGDFKRFITNYQLSLKNLAECGIYSVCYNFMPVLDWTRTSLRRRLSDGSYGLEFNSNAFRAFDIFILKRSGVEAIYSHDEIVQAEKYYSSLAQEEIEDLKKVILLGLPGNDDAFTIEQLKENLDQYKNISHGELKENLILFLKEVIPFAEEIGVKLAIHPDDPPRPILGLPRVVSTIEDLKDILKAHDSPSNGLTLCTGSLGAGSFNDCTIIAKTLAHRINFAHLRNVHRDLLGNFNETFVFEGDVDLVEVMKILVFEEEKRKEEGRGDWQIPVRPDHGNLMLGDIGRQFYPGYSLYGRMKGLAELRGLEIGIRQSLIMKKQTTRNINT
jgi:mannonate dehydratase